MSDTRLFQIGSAGAVELPPGTVQVERTLQRQFEDSLDVLLGVRFLATEYSTGAVHGGRIDTLGLDEDNSPVIVEYKRLMNENVINQGLFYLDWLLDHRHEFQWLVMNKLGREAAEAVDWASPRLLCVAADFTRYDNHAVKQIARNIELIRYRRFGGDLLLIEPVHAVRVRAPVSRPAPETTAAALAPSTGTAARDTRRSDDISYRLDNLPPETRAIWDASVVLLEALGDDVQVRPQKFYYAFKRLKNFCCLEAYPTTRTVLAHLRLDPDSVRIEPGFTRDMRGIGHFGTGDLQLALTSAEDVSRAAPLFQRAYDGG